MNILMLMKELVTCEIRFLWKTMNILMLMKEQSWKWWKLKPFGKREIVP
jgi:hypothetical protein